MKVFFVSLLICNQLVRGSNPWGGTKSSQIRFTTLD